MTTTKTTKTIVAASSSVTSNGSAAIDLNSIEFEKFGRREKGSDVLDFFAEKVLQGKPEEIEMVQVKGAPTLVFSKLNDKVRIHRIKVNGLNLGAAEVTAADEVTEVLNQFAPKSFIPAPTATKKEKATRSVFDADGNVLRQAPIGKIDRAYIYELEVLANEFIEMDPKADFGIHFRPAISKGVVKSLMMTVYTNGPEKLKSASPKGAKINLLGQPERLEEWLQTVQNIYNECAERLLDIDIIHESGFRLDRRKFVTEGKLVVNSSKKAELTPEMLESLQRFVNMEKESNNTKVGE